MTSEVENFIFDHSLHMIVMGFVDDAFAGAFPCVEDIYEKTCLAITMLVHTEVEERNA